jgi:ATP-binding cassette subfamily F protein 3
MDEKIERVMKGLGFRSSDMNRKMNEFSGGWKMRVELGKILLLNPDLLLLDEPTNHLDIESIGWLEEFLVDYNGSIVLISHDRTFLDNVTSRTIEISKGKVYDYKFSYSKYIVQREEEIERQEQAARNQQRYIEDTKQLIDKFRAKKNKAAFAQSLIKKLDRLEKIEVDDFEGNRVHIRFPPSPHAGKVIMEGQALGKAYGNQRLFKGLDLMINRGDKIALVGRNGVGKSTLLKILLGKEGHEGEVKPGYSVQIGYYAQNQSDSLDGDKTVFETIDDEARGEMRKNVRGLLGAFLFSGDDVDKKVKVLSGGEKARLAFCKLLLEPYNFLVLDEPTNHLDLISKEVLKEALTKYDGTILVVSHDRDFLNGLTSLVYEIQPERLFTWRGNVLDYLKEKKATSIAEYERNPRKEEPQQVSSKVSKGEDKLAEKEKKKLQQQLQRCEQEIAEAEQKLKQQEIDLSAIDYSDHEKSAEALERYNQQKKAAELLYQKWEDLQVQIDS